MSPCPGSVGSCRHRSSPSSRVQTYIVSGYLAILAALLILAGALSDHYGRRRVYAIGLAGFAGTSALCGLAPTMEWLIIFRLLQGAAGRIARARLAVAHHPGVRWGSSRPGVRDLGGFDIGIDRARTDHRRGHRRHDQLARRVPDQRPAPGHRAVGHPLARPGVERHRRTRAVRLARRGRRRPGRRRPVVRADPRPGERMGGHRGLGRHRRRRRRPGPVPDPDGQATEPARAARTLPAADLRHDQPGHLLHLRRAVRDLQLPGARPAGRARVYGARRRGHRHPDRDHALAAVDADRDARRAGWGPVASSSAGRC